MYTRFHGEEMPHAALHDVHSIAREAPSPLFAL